MPAGGNWKDLMRGIKEDDLELVAFHIRMGVDVNYQHPEYMVSPLMECAQLGRVEIAKLLLENGADTSLKAAYNSKQTALSIAQEYKQKEMVALLESHT